MQEHWERVHEYLVEHFENKFEKYKAAWIASKAGRTFEERMAHHRYLSIF
jgi:hypothetical protein